MKTTDSKLPRRPSPVLEVLFIKEGIAPENLPLRTIADTLTAVQRLASGLSADAASQIPEQDALGLLRVKRGSAVFQCTANNPSTALNNLRSAGRLTTDDPVVDQQVDFAIRPLEQLTRIAQGLNCQIHIRTTGQAPETLAEVDAGTYPRLAARLLVKTETSLMGQIMRVGGATEERCSLRIEGRRRLLYCEVSGPDLAKRLAQSLYDRILAHGEATWLQHSWTMIAFRITEMERIDQPLNLMQWLDELYDAGGKAWDAIADPSAYIREMRE